MQYKYIYTRISCFKFYLQVLDYQWRILNVIKLYLTRLLVTRKPQVNDDGSGPLGIFVPTWRALVGKVLCASPDCGSPSVYVPIFSRQILQPYQDFDKSLVKVNCD